MSDTAPTENLADRPRDIEAESWVQPPVGSRLRGWIMLIPSWVFAFVHMAFMLLCTTSPYVMRRWRGPVMRGWGKMQCLIYGVKLEIHGLEHRDTPGPKILLINHVSIFDLFLFSSLCPDNAVVIYKKEFHKIPLMGWLMARLGCIAVDRSNREAAIDSVDHAARTVRDKGLALFVAPEGTRSRKGGLQKFKLGPFHMALQTKVPLVPTIHRGTEICQPHGTYIVRPGVVRVDFLAPIPTAGWEAREVRHKVKEVRELFLRYLPEEKKD